MKRILFPLVLVCLSAKDDANAQESEAIKIIERAGGRIHSSPIVRLGRPVIEVNFREESPINTPELWAQYCSKVIDDKTLSSIAQFKQIRVLNLSRHSDVTDYGLRELRVLTQMQKLSLNGCRNVTDESLSYLKPMKMLVDLDLNSTQITDSGLKKLVVFEELESLSLSYTEITDQGLRSLVVVKRLQTLNLDGFPFGKGGFSFGPPSKYVTDDGIPHIAAIENLRDLSLSYQKDITDGGLKLLGSKVELRTLKLIGTGVTDSGLKYLTNLKQLKSLQLSGPEVTEEGVKLLRKQLPHCEIVRY